MESTFVPKKTITVQLDLETMDKFQKLCQKWGLAKTKAVKRMIIEASIANTINELYENEMEE